MISAPFTPVQRRTLIILVVLGLTYFLFFAWPNSLGARTESMLGVTSLDEPITYPYVVRMVTPAKDLREFVNRWMIYGDYHYGYPFYFFSSVVVVPVVWAHGALFTNFTQLNLLLLRQLISVLPMILAAGLLVFAQTRFHSIWKSVLLFVLLLSIRGVIRANIQWWHPDALSVLAVVLTLVFLAWDRLRFGKTFLLAALACGFAAGIKLAGFFFAPAVALVLLAGLLRKKLSLPRAALKALLFLAVMFGTLLITNPFLINSGARQEMLNIQLEKTQVFDQGYGDNNPDYQKGPQFWEWTLSTWFAQPWLLAFLVLSLLGGCFWGPDRLLNRLILAWIVPYSIYLFWFVAVKPDQYWLPVILPLYSAALNLLEGLPERIKNRAIVFPAPVRLGAVVQVVVLVILISHLGWNLARPYSGAVARIQEGLAVESQFH